MSVRRLNDTYSVFVGQIGADVSKNDLRELFQGCGSIAELVIMEDRNRVKKNFGFVRYYDAESAFRAASELNGWILKGSNILVDISKDTSNKIKREQGVALKKKRELKPEVTKGKTAMTSSSIKDTMYLNRLKDSLTSFNLQYAQVQVNYNRLLSDIGPISTFCPTRWASLKETVPFDKVSANIMDKCRGSEESMLFGEKRVAEFKQSLQVIISEISQVIDVDRATNLDSKQESLEEDNSIFDDNVVPESVRIIQKLEKYRVNHAADSAMEADDVKCVVQDSGAVLPGTDMPIDCLKVRQEQLDEPGPTEMGAGSLYDPSIIHSHQNNQHFKQSTTPNFEDDPLENLFLKMNVPRSSSRDSSLSDDSMDGNNIDDSGVECDNVGLGATSQSAPLPVYECYRAEGRQRPIDHRTHISQQRGQSIQEQSEKPNQEFSLETYILKSIGRGRGLTAPNNQLQPLVTPVVRGRGIFSDHNLQK